MVSTATAMRGRQLSRGTMSWIKEIEVSEAEGKLAETYATLIEQRGKVANILKVHSLNADALGTRIEAYARGVIGQ